MLGKQSRVATNYVLPQACHCSEHENWTREMLSQSTFRIKQGTGVIGDVRPAMYKLG